MSDSTEGTVDQLGGASWNKRKPMSQGRRNLIIGTCVAGGAAAAAAAWPFLDSWSPSERAKALGAPVEADFSKLEIGQQMTVAWRGKPVWIIRRSKEMLADLSKVVPELADPDSKVANQPPYARNPTRSIKPEYFVVIGICTHLGCSPTDKFAVGELGPGWEGGFLCPCHGSKFDLAGRVYKNVPAPTNLVVPPYKYVSDTRIIVGEDTKGA